MIDGDVESGSVMAGQSVGMVTREQSTREILDELVEQAIGALAARERVVDDTDPSAQRRASDEERARAGG